MSCSDSSIRSKRFAPKMPATDFLAILRVLNNHGVDFIVVGGVAAVLEGAPISTFDLDVVHARTAGNVNACWWRWQSWMPTIACSRSAGYGQRRPSFSGR